MSSSEDKKTEVMIQIKETTIEATKRLYFMSRSHSCFTKCLIMVMKLHPRHFYEDVFKCGFHGMNGFNGLTLTQFNETRTG